MLYLSALHVNEVFVKGLGGVVLVYGEVVVLVGVLDNVGGTVVSSRRCCSMFSCTPDHHQQGGDQHYDNHKRLHWAGSRVVGMAGPGRGEDEERVRMWGCEERIGGRTTSTYSNTFLTEASTEYKVTQRVPTVLTGPLQIQARVPGIITTSNNNTGCCVGSYSSIITLINTTHCNRNNFLIHGWYQATPGIARLHQATPGCCLWWQFEMHWKVLEYNQFCWSQYRPGRGKQENRKSFNTIKIILQTSIGSYNIHCPASLTL